jgi:quaternary ammonium compound-resistance protein SugE
LHELQHAVAVSNQPVTYKDCLGAGPDGCFISEQNKCLNYRVSNLSAKMNWIILIVAGLFEVAFAFCQGKAKTSAGTDMYFWYGGFLIALTISMGLLIKATQTLPIGTAYAVWTGIGAVGTLLICILMFKDPADFWRIFFIIALIGSTVGLKSVSH